MGTITWAGRLQGVGASLSEVAAIQAAYDVSTREVKRALNELIEGIDNAGLLQMLTSWRTGTGPFSAGMPGGGLPFGTEVPILSGNAADDAFYLGAGTGAKGTPGSGGSGSSLPSTFLTKTANYTAAAGDFVQANTSGGTFTVTLPLSPATGAMVTVKKTDSSGTPVAVVAQGGGSIEGDPAGASISAQFAGMTLMHEGSNVWTSVAVPTDYVGAMPVEPTAVKTANYSAVIGDFVPCDISAGSFTVTLPTAPTDQARIGVKLINVDGAHANSLTIARGGTTDVFNKAGGSTTLTLNALGQAVVLQYYATAGIWYVQARDTPLAQPLGAAVLGTDGTVGGPNGSPLGDGASVTKTANYTLTASDRVVLGDATGGTFTLTLPTAVGFKGVYFLKAINTNANAATIATTSSQTIDGAATISLGPAASGATYLEVTLVSDGANWRTV